ncbi:MAG: PorT family protein [Flavobacteriales bacterium]|nr:PorT family protein [Flavobacteriales bacterium]
MRTSKLITFIILSLMFLKLSAQNNDDRAFRFGMHFSPNFSWLSPNTSGYSSEGMKLGFSYGLSAEFFLSENYLFSTGVTFSTLGGKLKYEGAKEVNGIVTPTTVLQDLKINYLDIPLTLKLKTNPIGYIAYYGNFGVNSQFRFKAKSNFEYENLNGLEDSDVNVSSDVKFINISLIVGGGIEYNLSGNTNIMVGITYQNGFTNVLDSKTYLLDASGKATIDNTGKAVKSNKAASANLHSFVLNLGVYF